MKEIIEEPYEGQEIFGLEEIQQQLIDQEVNQLGVEDILLKGEIEEYKEQIIETYDKKIKQFRPDLKTTANLTPMKSYNDSWSTFVDNYLESPYLEALSDKEQIKSIADYMANIEDIRYENWKNLSLEQQVKVLNEMEQHIAAIEHRPSQPIYAEQLQGMFGYQLHNPNNVSEDKIAINTTVLEASTTNPAILDEVLNTLIHEGRHRYQHYNVEERLVHESMSEVNSWRENIYEMGYKDGSPISIIEIGPIGLFTNDRLSKLGDRLYYYQPVEIDARNFADDVMDSYHQKMEG